MVEQFSREPGPRRRRRRAFRADPWIVLGLGLAALVILPVAAVALIALSPAPGVWSHLAQTVLPVYLTNTLVLVAEVGLLAGAVGTGAAWLLVMYRFPLSRILEWALFLPLAIPAYIGAYALVDFLEFAGPVQGALRHVFGWQLARDYWFPEVRSREFAAIVLAFSLYPYVYLLVRAALREQFAASFETARTLGAGPHARFFRLGLPLSRPAIAAGVAIVMMETAADFGTVDYFAVRTLTTGVFTTWLEAGSAAGAAQIALVVLGLILIAVAVEKRGRAQLRFHRPARRSAPLEPEQLSGWTAGAATGLCLIPLLAGFALPAGVIASHALAAAGGWADPGLAQAVLRTVALGTIAALVTVLLALVLVFGLRQGGRRLAATILPLTAMGYAIPGAVLGLGLLLPLAAFDHRLADLVLALTGHDPGLILTGTAAALVVAYVIRFFALAQSAVETAMGRISPSLTMVGRSLGQTGRGVLMRIQAPMMRGSLAVALLLVFVDVVKELPATLLLRPFNFNTLATRVYEEASLENLGQAAPAAMLIILVGLGAVLLLIRAAR